MNKPTASAPPINPRLKLANVSVWIPRIINISENTANKIYDCFPKSMNRDLIKLNGQEIGKNIRFTMLRNFPDLVTIAIKVLIG